MASITGHFRRFLGIIFIVNSQGGGVSAAEATDIYLIDDSPVHEINQSQANQNQANQNQANQSQAN